jgi:hypothetical protein
MTATIKTETLPTYGEAVKAFDSCLNAFANSALLEESVIRTAYLGIHNGIQVRDYALGAVGISLPVSDSIRFLSIFKVVGESAHIEAIKGAYAYEGGEIEDRPWLSCEGSRIRCEEFSRFSLASGHLFGLAFRCFRFNA